MVYDKPTWTVYEHISPSGKKYIGITSNDPKIRWANGNGYKRNPHFWAAIEKYGWKNIQHRILFVGLQKKYADIFEIELIAIFKTTENQYGYNMLKGGRLGLAKNCYTDELKQKLSKIRKGKLMGKDNYKSRPIVCLNTKIHYECLMDAERQLNISRSSIANNCNGKQKYAGITKDKIPLQWMWEEQYLNCSEQEILNKLNTSTPKIINSRPPGNMKKVICLNNMKIFDCVLDASKYYNLSFTSGIIKSCSGVRNFSGEDKNGELLKWMYYDDFEKLTEKEKENVLSFKRSYKRRSIPTKIICLNTLETFNTCKETGKYTTIKDGKKLLIAIDNHKPFAKNPTNKEPLYWMRLEDYKNKTDSEKEYLKNLYYTGSFLLSKKEVV